MPIFSADLGFGCLFWDLETFGELSKNGTNLNPVILRLKHSKIYKRKIIKLDFQNLIQDIL